MHWTLRLCTAQVYFNIICARVHWIELNFSEFYCIRCSGEFCTPALYDNTSCALHCAHRNTSHPIAHWTVHSVQCKAGWDCDNISRCHGRSSVQSITLQGAARDVALAVIVGGPRPCYGSLNSCHCCQQRPPSGGYKNSQESDFSSDALCLSFYLLRVYEKWQEEPLQSLIYSVIVI